MELILIIGGIWLLWKVVEAISEGRKRSGSPSTASTTYHQQKATGYTHGPASTRPPILFKDSTGTTYQTAAGTITFKETSENGKALGPKDPLAGLHDAFTGAPLDPTRGLYRCTACKVW